MELTGELVHFLREIKNIPQWKLAEKLGANQSTICRIEKGVLRITPAYEYKLKKALEIGDKDVLEAWNFLQLSKKFKR